jgi:3-deoxy-D-manno-octulosonate 8-phosphate phosphatase (KDO 8-P phosphatase)
MKQLNIELIAYDFDGVMTDNKVLVDAYGNESVIVNRSDGLAINLIKDNGIPQIILSTETNPVVLARAKKIGIEARHCIADKKLVLEEICRNQNINLKNVLFVGNDLNDFQVMKAVGIPVAPQDAADDIKEIAIHVTKSKGGSGVIRELYDFLINRQHDFQNLLSEQNSLSKKKYRTA